MKHKFVWDFCSGGSKYHENYKWFVGNVVCVVISFLAFGHKKVFSYNTTMEIFESQRELMYNFNPI